MNAQHPPRMTWKTFALLALIATTIVAVIWIGLDLALSASYVLLGVLAAGVEVFLVVILVWFAIRLVSNRS